MGKKTHGPMFVAAIEHNDLDKVKKILIEDIRSKARIQEMCTSEVRRLAADYTEVPVLLAASLPDPTILKYLVLKQDVPVNFVHRETIRRKTKIRTPLLVAVRSALYETADAIVCMNADPNYPDHKGRTALHHAVRKADTRMAKLMLSRGAQVNVADIVGNTPLHIATIFGHAELVKLLIKHDGDLYKKGQHGAVPMHIAAKSGHSLLVRLFCEYGVNPNIKIPCYDEREKAPIHVAAEEGHFEVVMMLLNECGAEPNIRDSDGETPLHCVSINEYDPLSMKSKEDFTDTAKVILQGGAHIDLQNNRGETPLHLASRNEFQKTVEVLIAEGSDPILEDLDGNKPMDLVSPDDTVSKQLLKDAMEERERVLSDAMELQATGQTTSLNPAFRSRTGLNMITLSSSASGLNQLRLGSASRLASAGRLGSATRLGGSRLAQQQQDEIYEDGYLMPSTARMNGVVRSDRENHDRSHSTSTSSGSKGMRKPGGFPPQPQKRAASKSSLSVTTAEDEDEERSEISRSRGAQVPAHAVTGMPPQAPQRTDQTSGRTLPSPPAQRRQHSPQRNKVKRNESEISSVWDVSPRSSTSTFRPAEESAFTRVNKPQGPQGRVVSPVIQIMPAFPNANKVNNHQTTDGDSGSEDTYFDDESFDTLDTLSEAPARPVVAAPVPPTPEEVRKIQNAVSSSSLQDWVEEQTDLAKQGKHDIVNRPVPKHRRQQNKQSHDQFQEESSVYSSAMTENSSTTAQDNMEPPPKLPPRQKGPPPIPPKPGKGKVQSNKNQVVQLEVNEEPNMGQAVIKIQKNQPARPVAQPRSRTNHREVEEEDSRGRMSPEEISIVDRSSFMTESTVTEQYPLDTQERNNNKVLHPKPQQMNKFEDQTRNRPANMLAGDRNMSMEEDTESSGRNTERSRGRTRRTQQPKAVQPAGLVFAKVEERSQSPRNVSLGQTAAHMGQNITDEYRFFKSMGDLQAASSGDIGRRLDRKFSEGESMQQDGRWNDDQVPQNAKSHPNVHLMDGRNGGEYEDDQECYAEIDDEKVPRKVTIAQQSPGDWGRNSRMVSYIRGSGQPLTIVGGNAKGVFVNRVETGSDAHQKGVKAGDRILAINNTKVSTKTKESVATILEEVKVETQLVLRNDMDTFNSIMQNGGRGDSFFIRANFSYDPLHKAELPIKHGDIFAVFDTFPEGKKGMWHACKVSDKAGEAREGFIPNREMAQQTAVNFKIAQLRSEEIKHKGGFIRKSFGKRSKSLDRGKESTEFKAAIKNVVAYDFVEKTPPPFKRPVVLLGLFCDSVRELLVKDTPWMFDVPAGSVEINAEESKEDDSLPLVDTRVVQNSIQKNKHCIVIVSPRCIQFMQTRTDLNPMVVYLCPPNKPLVKLLKSRFAPNFDRKPGTMYDEAMNFGKQYGGLFTTTVSYTADDKWFATLKEVIDKIQNLPQWRVAANPEDAEDDEEIGSYPGSPVVNSVSPGYQHKPNQKAVKTKDDIPDEIRNVLSRHAAPFPVGRSISTGDALTNEDDPDVGIQRARKTPLRSVGYPLHDAVSVPADIHQNQHQQQQHIQNARNARPPRMTQKPQSTSDIGYLQNGQQPRSILKPASNPSDMSMSYDDETANSINYNGDVDNASTSSASSLRPGRYNQQQQFQYGSQRGRMASNPYDAQPQQQQQQRGRPLKRTAVSQQVSSMALLNSKVELDGDWPKLLKVLLPSAFTQKQTERIIRKLKKKPADELQGELSKVLKEWEKRRQSRLGSLSSTDLHSTEQQQQRTGEIAVGPGSGALGQVSARAAEASSYETQL